MTTLSRRTFLAAATAATATAATASGQETAKPVRLGVIGTGRRGTGLIATLLGLEGVEIATVCDVVADRAEAARKMVADKTGRAPAAYTQGERDYQRLLARDDVDAVVIATTWEWHAPMAVDAMRAGKTPGVEVPAALTLADCRRLVETSSETGRPCMMLENVCYFENALAILRMAREGLFGEMLYCEGGYQHDCRFLFAEDDGRLTWRGEYVAKCNGNQYPTHPVGPIAQWLGINRGDRFTHLASVSTPSIGTKAYMAGRFGPEHALAKRDYAQGDVNTTILRTARGRTVVLHFDLVSHRPYDLVFRAQGCNGIVIAAYDKACIENVTPGEEWAPFEPLVKQYAHPTWTRLQEKALAAGGHGGADYITLHEFVEAVRTGNWPQDVYDAATWSAIVPLSMQSVAEGGKMLAFPDFTDGAWQTRPPITM